MGEITSVSGCCMCTAMPYHLGTSQGRGSLCASPLTSGSQRETACVKLCSTNAYFLTYYMDKLCLFHNLLSLLSDHLQILQSFQWQSLLQLSCAVGLGFEVTTTTTTTTKRQKDLCQISWHSAAVSVPMSMHRSQGEGSFCPLYLPIITISQ